MRELDPSEEASLQCQKEIMWERPRRDLELLWLVNVANRESRGQVIEILALCIYADCVLKCDGAQPHCTNCGKSGWQCEYIIPTKTYPYGKTEYDNTTFEWGLLLIAIDTLAPLKIE